MVFKILLRSKIYHFCSHFTSQSESYEKDNVVGNYNLLTGEEEGEYRLEQWYNLIQFLLLWWTPLFSFVCLLSGKCPPSAFLLLNSHPHPQLGISSLIPQPISFLIPHVLSLMHPFFFISFFKNFIYLFIYLCLCWVFVSVRGLSLVAASRAHSSSRCTGLSLSWPLLLRSTGSRCAGSVVVAHGPSRSMACGILPDQGSNPCPLHWQADS